ncbi:MAG TPA: biotin transporter BioY [Actinomycetota bacterium]|nr:biotin transporter BioY [Actinomycetota bacterium]
MTTLAIAASPARIRSSAVYRVLLALAGSWLVAGLAQVEVRLPFTPVPVTGQTLGVLLVGAGLGPGLGALSVGLYLAQGAVGLPFFSGGAGGVSFLGAAAATGGYLWGFLLAATVVGFLARRGWDRTPGRAVAAMLLGEAVIYAVGLPWLMGTVDVGLARAISLGFTPFVAGDLLKLLIAAALVPAAWRVVPRR